MGTTVGARRPWLPALLPILLLVLLAPVLAETLSGATPPTVLVLPGVLFSFVVLVYGVQVLVIREVAVRTGVGMIGLWLLGVAYGIYNEALLAGTVFAPLANPIEEFADFGVVRHIRIPYALWILAWHGLFSVVTPVLLVERLCPRAAGRPWLPVPVAWLLGLASAGYGLARFVTGPDRRAQDGATFLLHLLLAVAVMVALAVMARDLPPVPGLRLARGGRYGRAFGAGILAYLLVFFAPQLLVDPRLRWPLFVAGFGAALLAVLGAIARYRVVALDSAVCFVLGAALVQAVLGVVFGTATGDLPWAAGDALWVVLFLAGVLLLRRRARRAQARA